MSVLYSFWFCVFKHFLNGYSGADPGGARRAPPKIVKNMIIWRKIVIFHTKYPKNFRASPPLGAIFSSAPP